MTIKISIALSLAILLTAVGTCKASYQAKHTSKEQQTINKNAIEENKDVERIEVFGQRSYLFYRQEYIRAENNFVKLFNELVEVDDFRISCKYRHKEGLRKERVCRHRYDNKIKDEVAGPGGFWTEEIESGFGHKYEEYATKVAKRKKEQIEHTADLIKQSPELKEAFFTYLSASQAFEKRKDSKLK